MSNWLHRQSHAPKPASRRRPLGMGATVALLFTLSAALLPASSSAAPPRQLPRLGDASSALVSPEIEDKIGRAFLQQIRATLPLSKDPILKYYTDTQLRSITQHADMQDNIHSVVLIEEKQIVW